MSKIERNGSSPKARENGAFGVPWVVGDRPEEVAGLWGAPRESGEYLSAGPSTYLQ